MADEAATTDTTAINTENVPVTSTIDTQATKTVTPIQTDLQKIEAAITDLKAAGEALFTDEIAALETKAVDLKAKAEAEIKAGEVKVKTIEDDSKTFIQKYSQVAAHIIEIALLSVIAAKILNLF